MKGPNTVFVCQSCGAQSRKWLGRCADCSEWNSLVEERVTAASGQSTRPTLTGERATLFAEIDTRT
jgi:DNA repair protein RadA/Sms